MKVGKFAKAVVVAVGAIVTLATKVVTDDVVDVNEVTQLLILTGEQALTLYATYKVRNKTDEEYI